MRLCISVFSLLLLCLFPLDAQQEYAESYIHISASVSLAEALDEIESQTNYSFIYDARVINLSEKLRSPLSGRTVFEILNLLFKDRTIVYTVMNDQIILSKKETIIQIQQKLDGKIKGIVTDHDRPGYDMVALPFTFGYILLYQKTNRLRTIGEAILIHILIQ